MGLFDLLKKKSNKILPHEFGDVIIKEAKREHVSGIAKLIAEDLGHDPRPYFQRTISDLKDKDKFVNVALLNDIVIGYGRIRMYDRNVTQHPGPKGWFLMGVIVSPHFRNQGIAKSITLMRLDWIKSRADQVFYITNESNEASIKLHENLGFVKIDEAKGFHRISFETEKACLFEKKF